MEQDSRFTRRSILPAVAAVTSIAAGCADTPNTAKQSELARREGTVDVRGNRVAYRSFGDGEPIVLLQRFRATMGDWDPLFIDALARRRRVIAFDNVGVGQSTGEVPLQLDSVADDCASFVRALGINRTPVLGWSMGGMVAQLLALRHPELVSHLVLTGTTSPVGTPEVQPPPREWLGIAQKPSNDANDFLQLFWTATNAGRAAGRASLDRTVEGSHRAETVKVSSAALMAQLRGAGAFIRNEGGWFTKLKEIKAPTLVASADRDRAFASANAVVLAREIPRSQLVVYPDSGHAFLFQYPERLAEDIDRFIRTA